MDIQTYQRQYEQMCRLAELNPLVYLCLQKYRHGEITWDEMMIMAVANLVVDNAAMKSTLQRQIEASVQPIMIKVEKMP